MDTQAYQNARDALQAQDYKAAERAFKLVLDSIDDEHAQHDIVQSYYGLTRVLNGDSNGLLFCRDAASNEKSDGNVLLNLACAEFFSDNRKRAIEAIREGIKIDPKHVRLNEACAKLDCRRKCCIAFLARAHKLNRMLGRWRRRPVQPELTVHQLLY